jgi:transposase
VIHGRLSYTRISTTLTDTTQAGWHLSQKLAVPPNITIVPLPPKCPELNAIEDLAIHARQLAVKPRVPVP